MIYILCSSKEGFVRFLLSNFLSCLSNDCKATVFCLFFAPLKEIKQPRKYALKVSHKREVEVFGWTMDYGLRLKYYDRWH